MARALTSARVTRLIEEADSPNATVVVLAPPVLAYADALALVDRVDGVLVVCDPRAVHRADLVRIRELITGAGGTVLGAVTHAASRRAGRRTAAKSGHRGGGSRASGRPLPPGPAPQLPAPPPAAPRVPAGDDTVALGTIRAGDR